MLSRGTFSISFRAAALCAPRYVRHFSPTARREFKVTVIGAAGGIGQPLSLLMKQNPDVTELRLYDLAPATPGVAADLSHIDAPAKVTGFTGEDMGKALKDADVVIVPAGVPRKPGMTRDDLFNTNANIVAGIAKSAAENCPNAALLIISNPVNSTVPIVAETLKKAGKYNPKKLFGVTTLDVLRANTFVAENQKLDPTKVKVPVIGGHAGITIVPLLSQVPNTKYSNEDRAALTKRIMFGGDEVVQAKAGAGSATLSMAVAGARFASQVIKGLKGEKGIKEVSFVESNVVPGAAFFSSYVDLGKNGIEKIHGLGQLDAFEEQKIKEMLPELIDQISKGVKFVNK